MKLKDYVRFYLCEAQGESEGDVPPQKLENFANKRLKRGNLVQCFALIFLISSVPKLEGLHQFQRRGLNFATSMPSGKRGTNKYRLTETW